MMWLFTAVWCSAFVSGTLLGRYSAHITTRYHNDMARADQFHGDARGEYMDAVEGRRLVHRALFWMGVVATLTWIGWLLYRF